MVDAVAVIAGMVAAGPAGLARVVVVVVLVVAVRTEKKTTKRPRHPLKSWPAANTLRIDRVRQIDKIPDRFAGVNGPSCDQAEGWPGLGYSGGKVVIESAEARWAGAPLAAAL